MKRVVLVAGGTRGDVQPLLVLAHALMELHIPVVIAASMRWRAMLTTQQIAWMELPDDPTQLLLKPQYHGALTLQHGIWWGMVHTLRFLHASRQYNRALLATLHALHNTDTCIVAGVATQWAMPALGGVWALMQPVIPTVSYPSALWPFMAVPRYYRLTHQVINWFMWQPWQWAGGQRGAGMQLVMQQPAVLAVSPTLMPEWRDRKPFHVVTGAWTDVDTRPLPMQVSAFVAQHAAFVVVSMGSPGSNEAIAWFERLCDAALACGVAVVMQLSKHHVWARPAHPDVCVVIGDINHQQLFRGAAVVIHHGGAGTFHTVCAAGVPSLIIARGIDQRFWGERSVALGVAPTWIARSRAKLSTIRVSLSAVIADPAYRQRARIIAHHMATEQGARVAARVIAQYVQT